MSTQTARNQTSECSPENALVYCGAGWSSKVLHDRALGKEYSSHFHETPLSINGSLHLQFLSVQHAHVRKQK